VSRLLIVFALLLLPAGPAGADSPLTSADFHLHYTHPMVKAARKGILTPAIQTFLLGMASTELKAAVVNALGWKRGGRASSFLGALAARYRTTPAVLADTTCTASELFVLGYLSAMERYQSLGPLQKGAPGLRGKTPGQLLALAAARAPGDFVMALILALTEAQAVQQKSFCTVYRRVQKTLVAFPEPRRNMKAMAVLAIRAYIRLYKKSCPGHRKPSEYNKIRSLIPFGKTMAALSYRGIVLWDRTTLKARTVLSKRSIRALAASPKTLWALVGAQVERWTGRVWRKAGVRNIPRKITVPCSPRRRHRRGRYTTRWCTRWQKIDRLPKTFTLGFIPATRSAAPDLFADRRLWRFAPAVGRFLEVASNPYAGQTHVYAFGARRWGWNYNLGLTRYAEDGTITRFPARSTLFPGKAVRSLKRDPNGGIWAVCWKGLYHLRAGATAFKKVSTPSDTIDIAFGTNGKDRWILHRELGVSLYRGKKMVRLFFLEDLEYARGLTMDPEGRLWVAADTGAAVIDSHGGRWRVRTVRYGR